jgi:hypothetical protein
LSGTNILTKNYIYDKDYLYQEHIINKKSVPEIANLLHCSRSTIRKNLILYNIKIVNYYRYGEDNPAWKGGKCTRKDGYVMLWNNELRDYELEHRVIMEKYLGRKLTIKEQVHHINEIKNDNRIENLKLMTISEHTKHHSKGKDMSKHKECICSICNKKFTRSIYEINKSKKLYCSRNCFCNQNKIVENTNDI